MVFRGSTLFVGEIDRFPHIYEKGSPSKCVNHKNINLIPITSELLAFIILRRLYDTQEEQTREEQADFRGGRSCVDQIFISQ